MEKKKTPGRIVTTKSGKTGVVYSNSEIVNGKIQVHVVKIVNSTKIYEGANRSTLKFTGEKLLCFPNTLTIIGYID